MASLSLVVRFRANAFEADYHDGAEQAVFVLQALQLVPSCVEATITSFEHTLEATRTGRRDHVGASADLRAVMAEVSEQVKVLDGVVRYRFGDNAELMGAWGSAHSVVGPFRSRTPAPASLADPGAGGETPTEVKAA